MATPRKEWNTPQKVRFERWWRTVGGHVARLQRSAVSRLHQEEQRRTGKYRPGRPRKISYEQIDKIEKWFETIIIIELRHQSR